MVEGRELLYGTDAIIWEGPDGTFQPGAFCPSAKGREPIGPKFSGATEAGPIGKLDRCT